MKPSQKLNDLGQSPWLDLIGRKLIHSGELLEFAEDDGIRGVTANPAIFEKAIVESDEYDDELSRLIEAGRSPMEIYETMAIADVRAACDVLRPLFERLRGADGFVSLEVSPFIARDTRATVEEAKRFWKAVDRPNLFIKIPGTSNGVPAIEESIANGIAINVTLLFSREQYLASAEAYMLGLERRVSAGLSPDVRSVASVFLSRWDGATMDKVPDGLRDKLGIAIGQQVYGAYWDMPDSDR